MRALSFIALFTLIIWPLAEASDRAVLQLRGRVDSYTNLKSTEDGVWVSSNQSQKFSIKLHKKGRAPASIVGDESTFIDKKTLIKEKVELIQIEAP